LREPFVSCCLENTSCAEAARQLGVQEATVWKRLSRARKLLQKRLSARGVSLTSALAAAVVGANAALAALPRSLVGPTIKAGADLAAGRALAATAVSAQVITLVEGVNQAMFLGKCKAMLLLLLGTAIVAAALGLPALRGARAEPAAPAP